MSDQDHFIPDDGDSRQWLQDYEDNLQPTQEVTTMTHDIMEEFFPSDFLKGDQLHGDTVVTIDRLERSTDTEGPYVGRPVAVLSDNKKWTLNATQARTLKDILGSDYTQWSGKQVTVFPVQVNTPSGPKMSMGVKGATVGGAPYQPGADSAPF